MKLWDSLDELNVKQLEKIEDNTVEEVEKIPNNKDIKLEINKWYKIRNVVSLYVDMKGSTQLSNEKYIKVSAKMYEFFTGSLIKILKNSDWVPQYIDIKGDGGFALWKEKYGAVKSLLAAITFKTFVEFYISKYVNSNIKDWLVASKIGITTGTVLVKKIGNRNISDNTYNWVVWAGKTVNISAKLSDLAGKNEILITDEIYSKIREFNDFLILSCGCGNDGEKTKLWDEFDETDKYGNLWVLKSKWCKEHGEEYLNNVLKKINEEGK